SSRRVGVCCRLRESCSGKGGYRQAWMIQRSIYKLTRATSCLMRTEISWRPMRSSRGLPSTYRAACIRRISACRPGGCCQRLSKDGKRENGMTVRSRRVRYAHHTFAAKKRCTSAPYKLLVQISLFAAIFLSSQHATWGNPIDTTRLLAASQDAKNWLLP